MLTVVLVTTDVLLVRDRLVVSEFSSFFRLECIFHTCVRVYIYIYIMLLFLMDIDRYLQLTEPSGFCHLVCGGISHLRCQKQKFLIQCIKCQTI
jgi:hypothetical protein